MLRQCSLLLDAGEAVVLDRAPTYSDGLLKESADVLVVGCKGIGLSIGIIVFTVDELLLLAGLALARER